MGQGKSTTKRHTIIVYIQIRSILLSYTSNSIVTQSDLASFHTSKHANNQTKLILLLFLTTAFLQIILFQSQNISNI